MSGGHCAPVQTVVVPLHLGGPHHVPPGQDVVPQAGLAHSGPVHLIAPACSCDLTPQVHSVAQLGVGRAENLQTIKARPCHRCKSNWLTYLSLFRFLEENEKEVSVQDLVNRNFEVEKLERKCQKCISRHAKTQSKILKFPQVFVIYLKRHKYTNTFDSEKKKNVVSIAKNV